MARALRWLWSVIAAAVLVLFRWSRRSPREERELPATRQSEWALAGLLFAAALAGVAVVVVYVAGADTQALGITLGAALALISAALILAARNVFPLETHVEERAPFARPEGDRPAESKDAEGENAELVGRQVRRGTEGVTRRRLLTAAGGTAGVALGAALITPIASLGPHGDPLLEASPWSDGLHLVDENDIRIRAADIEVGAFITGFPEGVSKDEQASPVVVVHVEPSELELPAERSDWAPEGFLAYSKICTHAGCAVNLFRSPLYPERSPGPALVCPCHYSTFDVLNGGERVFGPASRPLPQLPLRIEKGLLVAAGDFSGLVGPAWRGVRE